ncbi:MAG TPA: hypothetical protein DDZ67_00135, partial [Xanthomonadaceae bacterium]|nr:hypothetical protein [Xanthomonadaceae bacterium]
LARARRLAGRRRLRQLELLAQLCGLQLLIQQETADEQVRARAAEIGLDALADDMARESAGYRQVAIAAALCRARLRLLDARWADALQELERLRHWASRHGAGRLLIEVALLGAHALLMQGEEDRAQAHFDEAVGMSMFQGIVRPFVDARRFVAPLLERALHHTSQVDRFRDQFLRRLARAFPARPASAVPGTFSDAELVVLEHLGRGYSNKEIARLIGMSPDTVKYRLKSLFRKLGVHKRRDAVRVLHERGLMPGDDPAPPGGRDQGASSIPGPE